jgi:hypothetical protein
LSGGALSLLASSESVVQRQIREECPLCCARTSQTPAMSESINSAQTYSPAGTNEPRLNTGRDLANSVNDLVGEELVRDTQAYALVDRFIGQWSYQREFCHELLEIARGSIPSSWNLRRLAILMLEHQILKLPLDNVAEFAALLSELGIASTDEPDGYVSEDVLKEGYSSTVMTDFIREFSLRLSRLNRVHLAISGSETSNEALADFVYASRADCRLSLARYLLKPSEVADRIIDNLNQSLGVKDLVALNQPQVSREIEHCLERLPRFESEILSALCDGSRIYWVSDATSSEINSLVEYPLNTVVVVVKPSGSQVELEIKRAGARGNRPLDVVFERDGYEVPSTHRLHAGSMAYYLRWEAGAAAALSKIYRLIHGAEAPISRTLSVSTIYTVPVNGQHQHIVDYFSNLNGTRDADEVRRAMRESLRAFRDDEMGMVETPALPGDFGLATQFLAQVVPTQSILMNTSSFRLDRLESYLSPEGADIYFSQGLKRAFTASEARRFADELLDEILGIYISQGLHYQSYDQYVSSALAHSDNRARADMNYLSIMHQIGKFWGTLIGIRSYSYGESFVARNAALKSVFEDGEWRVKILFLDHDAMFLTGVRTNDFGPLYAIPNIVIDEKYIFGTSNIRGSVESLGAIYRVNETVASAGHSALNTALRTAYRRTQDELCNNSLLQGCFASSFVERIRDWDQIVARYLSVRNDPSKVDLWKDETTLFLQEKKYDDGLIRQHLLCIERYPNFLQKYSFLFS